MEYNWLESQLMQALATELGLLAKAPDEWIPAFEVCHRYLQLARREAWDELRALAGLGAGLDGSPAIVKAGSLRYPLPPRKEIREAEDPHVPTLAWRWSGRALEHTSEAHGWRTLEESGRTFAPTPERVRLWADLWANPYVEVQE